MNTSKNSLTVALILSFSLLFFFNGCGNNDEAEDHEHDGTPPAPTAQDGTPATEDKPVKIEWLHSVPEGLALAKEQGKPVFIDFYADWCPPCQQMDKVTFKNKQVIEELARFVAIKADLTHTSSPGQDAAAEYGVQAIPTYILIDTQGNKTTKVGYRAPDKFLAILKKVN